MKSKRLGFVVLLAGVALLTSGCELMRWLRLLSFKKQLAEFERYVRVEEKGGLTLHFLKPVVYADDINLLISGESLRTTNKNHVTWLWTYEKQSAQPKAEPGNYDLTITMEFEHLKFTEFRFPDRFLTLMPKSIIIGLLRTVGQAKIDTKHQSIDAKWAGPGPGQKVELPTKTQIRALLGEPFLSSETNGVRTVLYKYYQKTPAPESPAERLAWATFTFARDSEDIQGSQGVIGNAAWTLTRVPGEAEPRVTFSFAQESVEPVAMRLAPEVADACVGQYQGPEGAVLSVGRDGEIFALCYVRSPSNAWWTAAMPESANVIFGLPSGEPNCKFYRNDGGTVTGLVAHVSGGDRTFTKFASQLPPTPAAVQMESKVYAACAGRYKASWGGIVRISRQGEQLYWHNQGVQTGLPIYPNSETNFFFKAVPSPLTFVKNERGEVTRFVLHFNGHDSEATRLKEQKE
jgi:hypothetical protein